MSLLVSLFLSPLLIVTAIFAIEMFAGLAPLRRKPVATSPVLRTTIVIPAHDEEKGISATVEALAPSVGELNAGLLVVADNCSDRTASEARLAGAEVIERHEPQARGKGFALEFAKQHLRASPPDVVVILDADCQIGASSLRSVSSAAMQFDRPCQSVNLLVVGARSSPLIRISTFAFLVKNLIRQRALQRLGGRAHLTGTGMAFPWRDFESSALASSNIVEDLSLGLALAERGRPAFLVEEAAVTSLAASAAGTMDQRSRWEGGFLTVAASVGPRALASALHKRSFRDFFAALDLMVPPVALLSALNLTVIASFALAAINGLIDPWPVILHATVFAVALAGVALVWFIHGRQIVSFWDLLLAPAYVLWKVPHYVRLFVGGAPKHWIRGER